MKLILSNWGSVKGLYNLPDHQGHDEEQLCRNSALDTRNENHKTKVEMSQGSIGRWVFNDYFLLELFIFDGPC